MHAPRNDPRLGRWETRAIIAAAIVLFVAPAFAFATGVRGHPQENRASLPFPSRHAGWHALDEIGKALDDRMPLRSDAIRVDGWVDQQVFREDRAFGGSSRPRVIHGKDGTLFLADDIDNACDPAGAPAAVADGLRQVMTAISDSGRDVVTMVAPNKTTIETSLLQPTPLGLDCYTHYSDALWSALAAANVPGWVDLRTPLLSPSTDPTTPRYLRTDSHWNGIGSLVAVHAAVDAFAPDLWNDAEVRDGGPAPYTGDLTLLDGNPRPDNAPTRIVNRPDVTQVSNTPVDGVPVPSARHYVNSAPSGRLITGRTVMFEDSFGDAALPQLLPYFEDLTVVPLNSFEPGQFLSLIKGADHVWFMSVERHIAERVATQWATPSFLTLLRGLEA